MNYGFSISFAVYSDITICLFLISSSLDSFCYSKVDRLSSVSKARNTLSD